MITPVTSLTALQLMLLAAGAAAGGAIFGIIGFAFGIVISVFIHHAFGNFRIAAIFFCR